MVQKCNEVERRMSNWIRIINLKSVEKLDYKVPEPGVHLLSGTNGSGKTTLLACLRRIGHGNAFQNHFLTSLHSARLDSFEAAEVTYTVNERSVTYAYAGERWVPRPRSASSLVRSFGYPDVYYAGATAARITPRPEDFRPIRMNTAPASLIEAANTIFETDRFTHLKTINLTTGNRNQAFVLAPPAASQRQKYISEKNFSLGELCVLKLLRELTDCHNGSLVLIDELELALHPRAQIGLLRYLEDIAKLKALTVIVSTHSVTLLKRAKRAHITFLEKREGYTAVLEGCFPAYALGSLALSEERTPDVVFYVEDEAARAVLDSLVKLAIAYRFQTGTAVFPTVSVIPVGDFKNVVRFYDQNRSLLPDHVKQWIVLDQDVESESLQIMSASSSNPMRDAFFEHESTIRYLPWTPEVGLVEFLKAERTSIQQKLKAHYANAYINLPAALFNLSEPPGPLMRAKCKTVVKQLVTKLCEQIQHVKEDAIAIHLFSMLAEDHFKKRRNEAMQFLGPMIS
jgi:ABC-type lipoprotein export system ATPase subunit